MKDLITNSYLSGLIKFKVDHRNIYWLSENVFFQKLEGEEHAFWMLTSIQRLQFADAAIVGGALVKLRSMLIENLMDSVLQSKDVFEFKEVPTTAYVRSDKNRIIGKRSR